MIKETSGAGHQSSARELRYTARENDTLINYKTRLAATDCSIIVTLLSKLAYLYYCLSRVHHNLSPIVFVVRQTTSVANSPMTDERIRRSVVFFHEIQAWRRSWFVMVSWVILVRRYSLRANVRFVIKYYSLGFVFFFISRRCSNIEIDVLFFFLNYRRILIHCAHAVYGYVFGHNNRRIVFVRYSSNRVIRHLQHTISRRAND